MAKNQKPQRMARGGRIGGPKQYGGARPQPSRRPPSKTAPPGYRPPSRPPFIPPPGALTDPSFWLQPARPPTPAIRPLTGNLNPLGPGGGLSYQQRMSLGLKKGGTLRPKAMARGGRTSATPKASIPRGSAPRRDTKRSAPPMKRGGTVRRKR